MNRRQEIACWIFGVLLAMATASTNDTIRIEDLQWSLRPAPPLAIVGALVVYSMRTRGSSVLGGTRVLVAGLAAACALVATGKLRDIAWAMPEVRGIEIELGAIRSGVADIATNISALDGTVDTMESEVANIATNISELDDTVSLLGR